MLLELEGSQTGIEAVYNKIDSLVQSQQARLMTELLEKAFERIAQLPVPEQDTIASIILEELDSEEQWNQKFAASADVLSRLAQKALTEHRAGKTLPLDPDTL